MKRVACLAVLLVASSSLVARAAASRVEAEAPPPAYDDPDRDRILRLQEAIYSIVHGGVLGRLRVGIRVVEATTGRTLYGRRGDALMDPASNQKILATAAALLRLGSTYRFRTQVSGPVPDEDGVLHGDIVIRGTGDPSLRARHIDRLATALALRGVTRVDGAVVADPRRLGTDEVAQGARPPLRVGGAAIEVRVRPGERRGAKPFVILRPSAESFVLENVATTTERGRTKVVVRAWASEGKVRVSVSGRIALRNPGLVIRRAPPAPLLYTALLLRGALEERGIAVRDGATVRPPSPPPEGARAPLVLAAHDSDPLPLLFRRINKDSDNEYADRLLEAVGAEVYGGAATMQKGVRALRGAITELGLPPEAYVPVNGSGLGHANRISADAIAKLLRTLYLDPRIGPEIMQSLSVGGVDGTTRNRFHGSPAALRVRAKTGTLNGKSALSGYVGDGGEIVVFAMMVEGLSHRRLAQVRRAQVSAVDAMMRFARGAVGEAPADEVGPGTDFEVGEELLDTEEEEAPAEPPTSEPGAPAPPGPGT